MAMVGVVSGSLYRRTHSLSRLTWSWVGGRLAVILHSSNEPGELSQWLCHDDSTINIVMLIIIIIIIIIMPPYFIIVSCFHLSLASWLLFSNKVQFSSVRSIIKR